jgi:glycosyltransferase involved in cell wall biosynthesis
MSNYSPAAESQPAARQLGRFRSLIVIARVAFIDDESGQRVNDVDGLDIEEMGRLFEKLVMVASIFRPGRSPFYEPLKNCRYQFRHPKLEVVEMPDSGGSRRLWVLVRTFWRQLRILWRTLATHRDALVYIYFPTYRAAATAVFCIWQRRPYIVYSGGMWDETIRLSPRWGQKRPWYLPLYTAVCRALEGYCFRHAAVRLFFEAVRLEQYRDVPATYRVRPSTRIAVEESLFARSPGRPPQLLCVADILPVKAHDVLYRAVAQLRDRGVALRLVLVGNADPRWKEHLDKLAEQLNISSLISYRGWVSNAEVLRALYRESDILVLASHSEGYPRVIAEARAHGLPVITSNIPNIAAILKHGEGALLVPPGNPEALATTIEQLLKDEPLWQRLRANGYAYAREYFSVSRHEQFCDVVLKHL